MACPCRLVLDFSGNDTVSVRSVRLLVNGSEGFFMADTLICEDFEDEYMVSVPRGEVNVLAWYGCEGSVGMNEGLKIPYGEDCPQVYMDFFNLKAEGESVHKEIRMRKNHCIATLHVKTEELFPYRLVVKGEVDGYDPDGAPSLGYFMYELELSEDMTGWVTLPRQRDESLCLEICDGDAVLKVFTLGRYISATGYDYSRKLSQNSPYYGSDIVRIFTAALLYTLADLPSGTGDLGLAEFVGWLPGSCDPLGNGNRQKQIL